MPILKSVSDLDALELYAVLEKYYNSNNLYDAESESNYLLSKWLEELKPIRNVAPRSVEFYSNKIIAGPVETVTGEEGDTHPLKDAIDQVLLWSNFAEKSQLYKRSLAKLGDLFWKVELSYPGEVTKADKVFITSVGAAYVVDFTEDTRGYLEMIRIETPLTREDGSTYYRIEVYDKNALINWTVWESAQCWPIALDQLGDAIEFGSFQEFGIDFVPFVHVKFKDIGELRGQGCFTHALDKIDEANRQATRLAFMVFKNAQGTWWKKTMGQDKDGRPIPQTPMLDANGKPTNDLTMSDNAFVTMPAGSELISTIPPINYEAIRNIANDMVKELYEDMPELRYYAQTEGANLSGKALTYILAGAVDRAKEAGTNYAAGLVRVIQMALTMGQFAKVLQVAGSYDAGDFEFSITVPDPFPPDDTERANLFGTLAGQMDKFLAMKLAGYPTNIIEEAKKADNDAQKAKAELAVNVVNRISAQNYAARKEAAANK